MTAPASGTISPGTASVLSAVLATDPFLAQSSRALAGVPALAAVSQQLPGPGQVALSGLASQAAAVSQAFGIGLAGVSTGAVAKAGPAAKAKIVATSSNPTAVAVSATQGATPTAFLVTVRSLATAQVNTGSALRNTTRTSISGAGIIGIIVNGSTTRVSYRLASASENNHRALTDLRNAINAAPGAGVTPSLRSFGGKTELVLTAQSPGTPGAFTVSDVAGNAVAKSGIRRRTTAPKDATYSLNLSSSRLTGSGNTARLDSGQVTLAFEPGSAGKTAVISISQVAPTGTSPSAPAVRPLAAGGVLSSVSNFVVAFNGLKSFVEANSGQLGPVIGQQLQALVQANGAALGSIGITSSGGHLQIDRGALESAVQSNPGGVQTALFGSQGFAAQANALAVSLSAVARSQAVLPPRPPQGNALLGGLLLGGALVNVQD